MGMMVAQGLLGLASLIVIAVLAILIAKLIFPLPDIRDRPKESALPFDPQSRLGARAIEDMAAHPGRSGFLPIFTGFDALASRLQLAQAAEVSIDVQYYIWHDDLTGHLLLKALADAAQRGVRVRLLLDDNGITGLDAFLSGLDAMPNFSVRLFNPSTVRSPKVAGFLFDFIRMNRRMHNKCYIVDGAAAIIGGRNIGDEYFPLGEANFYLDLDVLALGPIASETAAAFDLYWNCASVFEIATIIRKPGDARAVCQALERAATSVEAEKLLEGPPTSAGLFMRGGIYAEWTEIHLVLDDPIKGLGGAKREQLMVTRLTEILGGVRSHLDLMSAYFVPGKEGMKLFRQLAKTARVRILTNAYNTTDVLVVHAGYTKYRRRLLKAGVALYELKLRSDMATGEAEIPRFGLAGASLHAKTFAIDGERVFIGSFNFDPRSALLNCEMGVLIDSPALARLTSSVFDGPLELMSYRPQLSAEGRLVWSEEREGREPLIYQAEPGLGWFDQIAIVVIGWLPIEWML